MSFYKPLMEYEKNFKLKTMPGPWYSRANGSSAAFGGSRATGDLRLWISF